MILNKPDLRKVRMGLAKCPTCGQYYDPTTTGGPCPYCAREYHLPTIFFVVVLLVYLCLPAPLSAAATTCEVQPDGSVMCCELQPDGTELCTSSAQTTPFVPTATPTPLPTATPTVTPTPTEIILVPLRPHRAFLPIIIVAGDVK